MVIFLPFQNLIYYTVVINQYVVQMNKTDGNTWVKNARIC